MQTQQTRGRFGVWFSTLVSKVDQPESGSVPASTVMNGVIKQDCLDHKSAPSGNEEEKARKEKAVSEVRDGTKLQPPPFAERKNGLRAVTSQLTLYWRLISLAISLVVHQVMAPPLQPLYTGLFANSQNSVRAQLFLLALLGNSCLPSFHIISGAGGPAKCHASHVAPRLAFEVTFSGATAPAGLAEQPEEHPAGE
ncbi:hypothetical protein Anapl_13376 [Anas platyrhynchos]|uniref:Uncharacterized protein n=1 Tax=Anas platyrhynchos TaxID=8839 RepID=R0LYD6_ANAPL|nr:hypothetical protein Anapl_13376 [Anas platyrhynchos]